MYDSITIMLKPSGGMCNMKCKYCFYVDEINNREQNNKTFMSIETMKNIISKAMATVRFALNIVFQGGEPTLIGLEFYRATIAYINEINTRNIKISYNIQTNGLLIDEKWCEFLKENSFLVGISLDGDKKVHDLNRLDNRCMGTFSRVMKAISLLKKYDIEFNVLSVLTKTLAKSYPRVYEFYKKNELDYQQYIPCLDPIGMERGKLPYSLGNEEYFKFLKDSFDLWYRDLCNGKASYNGFFNNLMLILNGNYPQSCGMVGFCSIMYAIESDGSVYPCDFYMIDDYYLGNLNTDSMASIDLRRLEIKFIEKSQVVPEECKNCRYQVLCRGGCRRDRDYFKAGLGKNYYCEAYKKFFTYSENMLIDAYMRLKIKY